MKKFDLERALAGKEVVTGLGIKVVEIKYFDYAYSDSCVAVVYEGLGKPVLYSKDGIIYDETGMAVGDELNLFMATTKRTVWAIVVRDTTGKVITMENLHDTEGSAVSAARVLQHSFTVIGMYQLEIEE